MLIFGWILCSFTPLHRIEFGPPKFFSKTFTFSLIFYSTWQISGRSHFRKACRSRKKESKPSEITCKQSELARTISKIEKRREFVRALCNEQYPKNSFKRLYIEGVAGFGRKSFVFERIPMGVSMRLRRLKILCWRSFYKSIRNCSNRCQRVSKQSARNRPNSRL